MGILSYIVQGFGWRVGSEIAKDALDDLRGDDDDLAQAPKPQAKPTSAEDAPASWWERRAARRAQERRAREERQAAERADREQRKAVDRAKREIEDELEALKRRVRDES